MDGNDKTGTDRSVDPVDEASAARSERRRTLLAGLGKGSTLLAAASPISSFAGSKVPKDDGCQCSVSGQMSKMLSGTASTTPCGGHHATYFVKCESLTRSQCPSEVKNACTTNGSWYVQTSGYCVWYRVAYDSFRKLSKDTSWPGTVAWNIQCKDVISNTSTTTCLQRIYEDPDGDDAFCIAGYLNSELTASPPTGYQKLPFDKSYVKYAVSSSKTNSVALFRKTCVKNRRTWT
ncbi:MAG: hypothetical protein JNL87_04100 [Burkholderiaceae bacterium]|nr:hypothetical protein [Burkholderiaceae bacterium]